MGVKVIILAKPLAVELGREELVEQAIVANGGTILQSEYRLLNSSVIARHYAEHAGKAFFQRTVEYYTGKQVKVYGCTFTCSETLAAFRAAMGKATNPAEGSIRYALIGDVFHSRMEQSGVADNGIHCSDSPESGAREWEVWFGVPPTSERTEEIHRSIWAKLSKIAHDDLQYAGGEHDGTAVNGSAIDLDYRLLSSDIELTAAQIQSQLGLVIDKVGVDDESGTEYIKFEIPITGGKCDVAVVSTSAYCNQVSKSHLIHLVDDTLKSECRAAKAVAKATGDKQLYKDVKRQWRKRLLKSINWTV